jgi:serine/threonine-protein kinase
LAQSEHQLIRPGGARAAVRTSTGAGAGPGPPEVSPKLPPGRRIGRYEIVGLLGEGGMGHVYCARDPTLGREVAIKALAGAFREDSASLRRLEREARVLAALSHPNIASIYGFEHLEGEPYLVLEKVDGETLGDRLRRGPVALREAVAIAIQVADALEEAHSKGVIHRDLKPPNLMLSAGGRVKVVDFGLAKAATRGDEALSSIAPTTAAGAILGTAPYMSPEQVLGQEVDARTDVWAFGCILYEMLSGRRAFPGRTIPELLACVLRDEPQWSALPAETPARLRQLIERCLRKEPRQRLQHIGDARVELSELDSGPAVSSSGSLPGAAAHGPAAVPGPKGWRTAAWRAAPWTIAALLGAALAGVLLLRPPRLPEASRVRLSLELPRGVPLQTNYHTPFAIAPSGTRVVLVGLEKDTPRLYVRELDDLTPRALPGTEGGKQPFFSTDGRWIAFFADRRLKKSPLDGGAPLALSEVGGNPRGGAWLPDGSIVMAPSRTSGLVRLTEGGTRPAPMTTLDKGRGEISHRWPEALPGGRWVLFTTAVEDSSYDEARLEAVSVETGERRVVLAGAGYGRYLAGGYLLFVRAGVVYRIRFDAENLAVHGAADVILPGVRYDPGNGEAALAVAASGALVYGPAAPSSPDRYLAWIDRGGRLTRLLDTPRAFRSARLGPNGRVAAVVGTSSEDSDLWVADEPSTFSRLSFGLSPHRPAWMPGGRGVTVSSEKDRRWRLVTIAADGSGAQTVLLEGPNRMYPNDWAPDGRHLLYQEKGPETGWDLRILEVDATGRPAGAPQPFAVTPFQESNAAISPDGRWVAYESDELDALVEVYLRSFPDGRQKLRALASASRPSWGGGNLYYWSTTTRSLHSAAVRELDGRPVLDRPRPVWGADGVLPPAVSRLIVEVAGSRFDLDPGRARFLFLETAAPPIEPSLSAPVVVLDWVGRP